MSSPNIAQKGSYPTEIEEGKTYVICTCGLSEKQPFCDGAHKKQESEFSPIRYTAEKTGKVAFCGCKYSAKMPLCDGTHKTL